MNITQIWVVSPLNYTHSHAFDELALSLHDGLHELGHEVKIITDHNLIDFAIGGIVLGAHLLSEPLPKNWIIYNTEQASSDSQWYLTSYMQNLRSCQVWDYSLANIRALAEHGIKAKLCEVGYVPALTRIENNPEYSIDVLHIGSMNERRAEILQKLELAGLKTFHAFNCYGIARDALIARAKICLNMHFFTAKIFEIVRCSYFFSNRKFIVSEYGADKHLEEKYYDGAAFAEYDNLVDTCLKYLADEEGRSRIAQCGYEIFKAQSQVEFLRPLLTNE